MILLVRRVGIDRRWQHAPYTIRNKKQAERIMAFLRKAMQIPLEWKLISEDKSHE